MDNSSNLSSHELYNTWKGMIHRCYNRKNPSFKNYSSKGVGVCERWRTSFTNFLEDMGPRPEGHSLDRKDGTKGYSPDNCRWVNAKEQQNNRSNNVKLTLNGKTRPIEYWSDRYGISVTVLRSRIRQGWTAEDTVLTPVRSKRKSAGNHRGKEIMIYDPTKRALYIFPTVTSAAKELGIPIQGLSENLLHGYKRRDGLLVAPLSVEGRELMDNVIYKGV